MRSGTVHVTQFSLIYLARTRTQQKKRTVELACTFLLCRITLIVCSSFIPVSSLNDRSIVTFYVIIKTEGGATLKIVYKLKNEPQGLKRAHRGSL